MIEGLAKVATGFAMISEGINEIILRAQDNKSLKSQDEKLGKVPTEEKVPQVMKDTTEEKIEISREEKIEEKVEEIRQGTKEEKIKFSKEQVREVLAKKSQAGKRSRLRLF